MPDRTARPMRIFKYPLAVMDAQTLEIPSNYLPLSLQLQNGVPTLWAIVSEDSRPIRLRIRCCGTGDALDRASVSYLGTVQMGEFVWHYFVEARHAD